jgi:uncharacterized protein
MSKFNYEAVKDLLRCPKSRAELVYAGESLIGCDPDTRLKYPIVDGFPVLLIDEATVLSPTEWAAAMKRGGRDPVTGDANGSAPPKG